MRKGLPGSDFSGRCGLCGTKLSEVSGSSSPRRITSSAMAQHMGNEWAGGNVLLTTPGKAIAGIVMLRSIVHTSRKHEHGKRRMTKTMDDVVAEAAIKDVHIRYCRANDRRDEE